MGAGVSNWRLANAVSRLGQLGVVSGTALDVIVSRRLQDGDEGGHMRRAIAAFPVPGDGRARPRAALRRGRAARGRAVPGDSDVRADGFGPRAHRALHRREFRRGLSRARGARRPRRDQLPREDPAAGAPVDVRGDAGRRGGRPHGRRHPDPRSGRPRRPRASRALRVPAERDGLRRRRRHDDAVLAVGLLRGRAAPAEEAGLLSRSFRRTRSPSPS